MAASRRSPLMRDQWRADEDHHSFGARREQRRGDYRHRSPTSRRAEGSDLGLKIKGRATLETTQFDSPKRRDPADTSKKSAARDTDYISQAEGEGRRRKRRLSKELSDRHSDKFSLDRERLRERSASPDNRRSHKKHYTRRSRSRDRGDRATDPVAKRRDRAYSSQHNPRREYESATHSRPVSRERPILDSYVPSARSRRSRSPLRNNTSPRSSRRRSPSPARASRRSENDPRRRQRSRRLSPRKFQRSNSLLRNRERDLRAPSPIRQKRFEKHSRHSISRPPAKEHSYKRRRLSSRSSGRLEQRDFKQSTRSRHSSQTRLWSPNRNQEHDSEMHSSTRPIQSILDEQPRQPSPPRPIPSFDDANNGAGNQHLNQGFSLHGVKSGEMPPHNHRRIPPHIDTRQSYGTTPQYVTPTSSHHGSPQSGSPYSHGRGGWAGQQHYHGQPGPNMNAYSPPFRQNSYPPPNAAHGQYYPSNQHNQYAGPQQMQPGYQSPSFRGGHSGMRGNNYGQQQDRRFSNSSSPYGIQAPRGRGGHFQNLQWTASGGTRGRGQADQSHSTLHQSGQSQSPPPTHNQSSVGKTTIPDDEDNPFRPSKDLQVEDQSGNDTNLDAGNAPDVKNMPPPARQGSENSQQSKESKGFSFSLKKRTMPSSTTRPVSDLVQKMKDPPARKEAHVEKPKPKAEPTSVLSRDLASRSRTERRPDTRADRRDDRRDDPREREYRDDNRYRDDRRVERDVREHRRPDHRVERRPDRERERSPEPPKLEKKIMKRVKPRPTLPTDFAASDSVYYRKPGNESVVGSGTYGKVFKAIHVYTKSLVALKKIRMEGERDGFPVTAVREIKLLQSLNHENVVKLQEVMVEKNDCFMVFEYLSHDLTGLLNHPTFKLENSHKKHLAKQLFEGLDYLHRRGVLHRDIKAANILISNTGQLKLADFGLARFFVKRRQLDYTNRVITIWYRPPELLLGETQYGPAVDIWSAACVMIEIFTKHAIFPGDGGEINQLDKIYNVLGTPTRSEWPNLVEMAWFELLRPSERKPNVFAEKYRDRLTPAAYELLQAMFLYDPAKRPTAGDALEHPYFTTEEPPPAQAVELKDLQGDWHEFESKALRRENERKIKEERRAVRQEEHQREKEQRDKENKEKRRASEVVSERDPKRPRPSSSQGPMDTR